MKHDPSIRRQVLRGIAHNRTPGSHFAGNFLDISFDQVASGDTRLSLEAGPHCIDADGQADTGALAMLADFALATSIRAELDPATRLATVSMTLELSDAPRTGVLKAAATLHGFAGRGYGRVGRSRVVISGGAGEIGFGSGTFMILKPPPNVTLYPMPHRRHGDAPPPVIAENELRPDEMRILRHAEAMLDRAAPGRESFLRHFWGFLPRQNPAGASCAMMNGPHVGNRVGHAQGGILLGLAAATASCALPSSWALTGISGAFISPGEGSVLRARSTILHHGRQTSVIRTQVTGRNRRRVLEVMTTHAHRQS